MSIYYAMGLHFHQPMGNLKLLLKTNPWEARQIILCYQRPSIYAKRYPEAKFHLDFSGILLEQLMDPEISEGYKEIIDLNEMMKEYSNADNIEFLGSGYYHPVFPLIPVEDWDSHIRRWKEISERWMDTSSAGFWPPEMGFCMEMIPTLEAHDFKYVIIDDFHIHVRSSNTEVLFKPGIARHDGAEITIIPRNRDLSNAQESGLNPGWFEGEVRRRTEGMKGDCLITTWSDGENGGWFRNINANFWGEFYGPLMESKSKSEIIPIKISEYIGENPPELEVEVGTGAWNVADTSGYDFTQWQGSEAQRRALKELWETSRLYHELRSRIPVEKAAEIEEHVLKAETSCNLFWGESWIPKLYEETRIAKDLIREFH